MRAPQSPSGVSISPLTITGKGIDKNHANGVEEKKHANGLKISKTRQDANRPPSSDGLSSTHIADIHGIKGLPGGHVFRHVLAVGTRR